VNATVDDLGAGLKQTLASVNTTVGTANALIDDVGEDVRILTSASARITSDAAQIADGIRKGEGTIGKLLKDDELYKRVTTLATSAEAIAADTREAVRRARQAIEGLQAKGGEVTGVTANLKDTLDEARTAMAGLAENMEAMKRGFFFRGYFNRRGYFSLDDISPEEYRKGVLTRDPDRRVTRAWFRDDELFDRVSTNGGAERLTDAAKARLDEAMVPYLGRLTDTVVMIEGYARAGSAAEQHVVSRARAELVRDYLIGRFRIDAGGVGVMPLGADAVDSPGGSTWSGVALAVFVDR
jgi:phospholipid/cholesterol/gamma-HCH transport system substrate-binding protein